MGIFDLGACKPGLRAHMDSRTGRLAPRFGTCMYDPYSRIVTIGSALSLQEPHAQQLTDHYMTLCTISHHTRHSHNHINQS